MTIILYAALALVGVAGFAVSRSEDAKTILRDVGRLVARWVLWSPRHAAAAVVAAVVLLAVAGALTGGHGGHATAVTPPPAPPTYSSPAPTTPNGYEP